MRVSSSSAKCVRGRLSPWLTDGCVTDSFTAALVTLRVRYRRTNVHSKFRSIQPLHHISSVYVAEARTAKALRHSVDSDYLFVVERAGRGRVEQDGRQVELHIGDAVVYDTSRPYVLGFPDPSMEELVLQLPRTLVGHGEADLKQITARIIPNSLGLRW